MQIKRRLTKIANSLSPQIEVMNAATEMERMCDRFEAIITYCQEKIDRTAERAGRTTGMIAQEARDAADKVITDHQTAEVEANQADQQEAFDDRNKDPGMVDMPEPEPEVVHEEPPKQRKKKASKKKAKKKK